jgi:hypothetical protein
MVKSIRWIATSFLLIIVALGAAGCILVPYGGYGRGYGHEHHHDRW